MRRADDEVLAVLRQDVLLETLPKSIARDRHPACLTHLDVDPHIAEDIRADGHIALTRRRTTHTAFQARVHARAKDADVRRAGRLARVLERAARDRHLADGAARGVQLHIRGGRTFRTVIALDVTGADVQILRTLPPRETMPPPRL